MTTKGSYFASRPEAFWDLVLVIGVETRCVGMRSIILCRRPTSLETNTGFQARGVNLLRNGSCFYRQMRPSKV